LLELHKIAQGDAKQVPPELLEEVFELNMLIEEAALSELAASRGRFRAMLDAEDAAIAADFARWDRAHEDSILEAIRARLNRRKYISNLVRDTEKALESNVSN
jgi:molecular chaperone HscB